MVMAATCLLIPAHTQLSYPFCTDSRGKKKKYEFCRFHWRMCFPYRQRLKIEITTKSRIIAPAHVCACFYFCQLSCSPVRGGGVSLDHLATIDPIISTLSALSVLASVGDWWVGHSVGTFHAWLSFALLWSSSPWLHSKTNTKMSQIQLSNVESKIFHKYA